MTAKRITKGRVRPGTAIRKARSHLFTGGRAPPPVSARRERNQATTTNANAATAAGNRPPVNRAAIEMLVTEPIVISTRLGGIVSDIALEVASSEASSPGWAPRRRISGNRIGATAAMSAAFDPEIPETRYIAPSST